MSIARSLRRAAERKAQKQARKLAQQTGEPAILSDLPPSADQHNTCQEMEAEMEDQIETPEPVHQDHPEIPVTAPRPAASPARLSANRANSQLSTGPKTDEGKRASSKNALKTALTGRTVLLASDDAEQYAARLTEYDNLYEPTGIRETEIVQALCDAWWRLDRIPGIIQALYVKGAAELTEKVADYPREARASMLRMETYLAYERQFRNLEIQEQRLHRHAQKLKEELKQIQKERWDREADALARAGMLYLAAQKDHKPFDPASFGFEFSATEIESYLYGQRAGQIAQQHFANAKSGSPAPGKQVFTSGKS